MFADVAPVAVVLTGEMTVTVIDILLVRRNERAYHGQFIAN